MTDVHGTAPVYIRVEDRSTGDVRLRVMVVGQPEVVADLPPDAARTLVKAITELTGDAT